MKLLIVFFIVFVGVSLGKTRATANWKSVVSVEDFCSAYPDEAISLMDQLNLDYKGLESVKQAKESGNTVLACTELLKYFQQKEPAQKFMMNNPVESFVTEALADTILNDVFVIQNVKGKVPMGNDGHRDWYYRGPNNDAEWAWLSNRHPQIDSLFYAYFRTGNQEYIDYIDAFLRDFIVKSWPYPAKRGSDAIWRGLEVSFRAKVWTKLFYGLLNNPRFSPATQLLILSSLPNHAHYNRNFHAKGNWLTMEISGLATVAAYFPEYKMAGEWMEYAIKTMTASLKEQVYPDGVQNELTSHYHRVALENFSEFRNICTDANIRLSDYFYKTIDQMLDYTAKSMRPDGFRLLNNDGDKASDRAFVNNAAISNQREDWKYIATNGMEGTKPAGEPSYFYPWAGHLVSRSGFDRDAQWSFFDIGPWGAGHEHNDKLHLSVASYGRDLLVDAGRFAYTGDVAKKFRAYAISSFAHNTIVIDKKSQDRYQAIAEAPVDSQRFKITPEYDYATGTMSAFQGLDGKAEHTRAVMYVRGDFWVVVDRVVSDRPHEIKTLWHWHPDCSVMKQGNVVKSINERGNLAIIPITNHNFKIEMVKGQDSPVQGWYSSEYNVYEPNLACSYSSEIDDNEVLVWLLLPFEKDMPKVKAKIISSLKDEIQLQVSYNSKEWKLTVPFSEANGCSCSCQPNIFRL